MYSVQSSSKRKAKQASKHSFNSLEKGKKKKGKEREGGETYYHKWRLVRGK